LKITGFFNREQYRTAENPLAYLKGQNPKTDIRHARRALSADELDQLIRTTAKGQKHSAMTGKERAMLYTLAVSTGLRAREISIPYVAIV